MVGFQPFEMEWMMSKWENVTEYHRCPQCMLRSEDTRGGKG